LKMDQVGRHLELPFRSYSSKSPCGPNWIRIYSLLKVTSFDLSANDLTYNYFYAILADIRRFPKSGFVAFYTHTKLA